VTRVGAEKRLERLLVLVPWVMQNDGPEVSDVCARFDMTEDELANDLELLFLCGLYPFTPDTLIEADIVDGRVWIRSADQFQRPPRFTAEEALALFAAASTVADLAGNEDNALLKNSLAKLSRSLGLDGDDAVAVDLGPATPGALEAIQTASKTSNVIELDYYSYGRDEWNRRRIEPVQAFHSDGHWYLQACAQESGELRNFRLDRMRDVIVLNETFLPPTDAPEPSVYQARETDPIVKLELDPEASWVMDQYPIEDAVACENGKTLLTMRISEKLWLERLLLRLGEHARVVEGDIGVQASANQILRRYEGRLTK
jgi:proteasome accessory factor C